MTNNEEICFFKVLLSRWSRVLPAASLLILCACESGVKKDANNVAEEALVEPPVLVVSDESEAVLIEDLVVNESFDWSVTYDLKMALYLIAEGEEDVSQKRVDLYSGLSIEEGQLLFSGWPSAEGRLSILHRVEVGNKSLFLLIDNDESKIVDIVLPSKVTSDGEYSLDMTVSL